MRDERVVVAQRCDRELQPIEAANSAVCFGKYPLSCGDLRLGGSDPVKWELQHLFGAVIESSPILEGNRLFSTHCGYSSGNEVIVTGYHHKMSDVTARITDDGFAQPH